MAIEVGIIKTLIGTAIATAIDGTQRNLHVGDRLFADEIISTGVAGAIEVEFSDGSIMDMGRSSQTVLDTDTFDPQQASQIQAEVQNEVEALQQALLDNIDPSQVGEATAAGTDNSGNEGAEAVVVEHLAPEAPVTSGFETTGPARAFDSREDIQGVDEISSQALDDVSITLEATPQITEDNNVINYTVTLSLPAVTDMTITLSNGGIISILQGEISGSIDFPVSPDSDVYKEEDETIDVSITATSSGGFGDIGLPETPSTTTVVDSIDTVFVVIEGDRDVIEGNEASYTVKLVDQDGNPVIAKEATTVTIRYTNDTTQDNDTEHSNGNTITVTIAPNTSEISFNVNSLDDFIADNGEEYQLEITAVDDNEHFENIEIDPAPVVTAILDDTGTPNTPNDGPESDHELVIIKLVAANSAGDALLDGAGNYVLVEDAPEGGTGYYLALAFAPNSIPSPATLIASTGTVTVSFSDDSATGISSQTAIDGSQDYDNNGQTVTIGTVFSTAIFDDYLVEGAHTFNVAINDGSYVPPTATTGYENVSIDTEAVITTIIDGADDDVPNEAIDTVTIKLVATDAAGNIIPDATIAEGNNAYYKAILVDSTGAQIVGATGNVNITFTDSSAVRTGSTANAELDFSGANQTVALNTVFSATALDDYLADNGETFNVQITTGTFSNAGTYENTQYDTSAVITTIIDDTGTPNTPNDGPEPDHDSVIIKLVAADSAGNPVLDGGGNYVLAQDVAEAVGAQAYYIALAFEPGSVPSPATLIASNGTVTVSFSDGGDGGATGASSQTTNNGSQDYDNDGQIITIGQAFSTTIFDDLLVEGDHSFNVAINDGSYKPPTATTGYENVNIDTTNVVTTITDDGIPNEDIDTVYAVITGPSDVNEGDATTNYTVKLLDEDGNPVVVTNATNVTVTYTNGTTEDGDTQYNNGDTIIVTIPVGASSATFTVNTIDDFLADNDEDYKLEITNLVDTGEFENINIDGFTDTSTSSVSHSNNVTTTIHDDTGNPNTVDGTDTEGDHEIVQIKLVALDEFGAPIFAADGRTYTFANDVQENAAAQYKAVAFHPDATVFTTATQLLEQFGSVTVTSRDLAPVEAKGIAGAQSAIDGSEDYTSISTLTVDLNQAFSIDTLDDYLVDHGERFEVAINDGSYIPLTATTGYENVDVDTTAVVTTITDGNLGDETPNEAVDTVYAVITGPTDVDEGDTSTDYTVQLLDQNGDTVIVTVATDVTVTYTNGSTEDSDTEYNNNATITVTIPAGGSSAIFTVDTTDDYLADNDEDYNLNITNVATAEFENIDTSGFTDTGGTVHSDNVTTTIHDDTGTPNTPNDGPESDHEIVQIKLVALDESGNPIFTADGITYTFANDAQENAAAQYKAVAFHPDAIVFTTVTQLPEQFGSVTVTSRDLSLVEASGISGAQSAIDGSEDYSSISTYTVNLNQAFSIDTLDDYLVDSGERFEVAIDVGSYIATTTQTATFNALSDTADSNTFSFGVSQAGETVTINFDLTGTGGWESSGTAQDYFSVDINGAQVANDSFGNGSSTVNHHYTFIATLDVNGDVVLNIGFDTTHPGGEIATISNVAVELSGLGYENVSIDTSAVVTTITDDSVPNEDVDTVTVRLVATDIAGNIIPDATIAEGATAYYKAILVDSNGAQIVGATGDVDITFTDGTAIRTGTSDDAELDFAATNATVALNTVFSAVALDDYLADTGEAFNVQITSGTYTNTAPYENTSYDTTAVVTTIIDDTGTPNTPNDGPESDHEVVQIKLVALDELGNPILVDDGNGDIIQYTFANDAQENAAAQYKAIAFYPDAVVFTTATQLPAQFGSVTVTSRDLTLLAEAVGISGAQSAIDGSEDYSSISTFTVNLNQVFSVDTLDDYLVDSGERFEVTIDAGSYSPATTTLTATFNALSDTTDSNTFSFGAAQAGETVTIDFDLTGTGGWESTGAAQDFFSVGINGAQVANDSFGNGSNVPVIHHYTFTATLDINGDVVLDLGFDTSAPGTEIANISNVAVGLLSAGYENVTIDTDAVITTISDGSGLPPGDETPNEPIDTVYVKITHNDSVVEGNALSHTITLVDKDGNVVTVPAGNTVTVNLTYNPDTTELADFDSAKTIQVTLDGVSSVDISNLTIDDFVVDGPENYTLTITSVSDDNGVYENIEISTVANGASEDATSVTGEIRDGVSLGVPTNANVDEDTFVATNSGSLISDTQSLNITAPTDDNGYTLSFDNSADPTFTSDDPAYVALTSNGIVIEYEYNGDTVTAYAGAGRTVADKVFDIVLDKHVAGGADDDYTYTQYKNIAHPTAGDSTIAANDDDVVLTFGYKITDGAAVSGTQTFTVTVNDSILDAGSQVLRAREDRDLDISISQESFNNGEITLNNGVDGDVLLINGATLDIYDVDLNDVVGLVTNNGDGTLTFTPNTNYSGDTNGFTFIASQDTDGDTASGSIDIRVRPQADRPDFDRASSNTNEDTSVVIGLDAPRVRDNVDQNDINGATAQDHAEALGLISLFNVASGIEILDGSDSVLWTSSGGPLFILLSDGEHTQDAIDLYATNSAATNYLTMTSSEYEALKINPNSEAHNDINLRVSVREYEVDDANQQLANNEVVGANGRNLSRNYHVEVRAVTDETDLNYDAALNGLISTTNNADDTFTHDNLVEGSNTIDLRSLLTETAGTQGDTTPDLDGSEQRSYTVSGIPEGTVINLGGITATAGVGGSATVNFNAASELQADPSFTMTLPEQYSGSVTATIVLTVQDTDADSNHTPATMTETVYFNVDVAAVADQVTLSVSQARGLEDAGRSDGNISNSATAGNINDITGAINLNIGVTSDDIDGSETYTVIISSIPNNAVIYYNGAEVIQAPAGTITLTDFDNSAPLKIVPEHNSDADFDLTVEAFAVDSVGATSDTGVSQVLTMNVQVEGVADIPMNDALNEVVFSNGGTYQAFASEDMGNIASGATINFKDIYVNAGLASYDNDGSETLNIIVTGLAAEFNLEGATFMGGNGADRKWVFNAAEVNTDSITVTTEQNYSGEIDFTVKYVTTEQEGDSKTHADVPITIIVTPETEATMNLATDVLEDISTAINFGVVYQSGDTDETIETVFINVDDVTGKEFTLSVNGVDIAAAGLAEVAGFYELIGADINNVTVQYDADIGSSADTSFGIKYTTKDSAAGIDDVSPEIVATYNLTLSAVTDDITVEHNVVANADIDIAGNGDVTVNTQTTIAITVDISGVDTASENNGADLDGSESITRIVVEGVPDGVRLVDGLYGGNIDGGDTNIWYIDIDPNIIQTNPTETYDLQLIVDGDDSTYITPTTTITITAYNQDGVASEQNGSTTFRLIKADDTTFTDNPPATPDTPTVIDSVTGFVDDPTFEVNEDAPFTLADIIDVNVDNSGSATDTFAITITGLNHATLVGINGAIVTVLTVDGETVYNLVGSGNEAEIITQLGNIQIIPDLDFNVNNAGGDTLGFEATLTTYADGGQEDSQTVTITRDVIPVTDVVATSETISYVDESGSASVDPLEDGTYSIGINLTTVDDLGVAGPNGDNTDFEFVQDGTGAATATTITITHAGIDGTLSWAGGTVDFDAGTTSVDVPFDQIDSLTFEPALNEAGSVTLTYEVFTQETGASNVEMGTGVITFDVLPVTDGLDVTGLDADGDEFTNTGPNLTGGLTGTEFVELLRTGGTLGDATLIDGSESIQTILVDGVPNGFLVFFGADGAQTLAQNAGSNGAGANTWNVPVEGDGTSPQIWIKAPQDWSGDVPGIELTTIVSEGSSTSSTTTVFTLTVNAVASSITISPTNTFHIDGAYNWTDINLNANLADLDGSETVTLSLIGLDDTALFRLADGTPIDGSVAGLTASFNAGEWILSGIPSEQINNLEMLYHHYNGTVDISVVTVDGGDILDNPVTGDFELDLEATDTIDLSAETRDLTIITSDLDTTVTGGSGDDIITGGAGNDTIDGGAGNDTIDGGAGNDTIDGGEGNDILVGGEGSDQLFGGDGSDTLDGGAGSDTLTGGADSDTFIVTDTAGGPDTLTDFDNDNANGDDDTLDLTSILDVGDTVGIVGLDADGDSSNDDSQVSVTDSVTAVTIDVATILNNVIASDDILP